MKTPRNEYHSTQAVKRAIASELARSVQVTPAMIDAHHKVQEATSEFRDMIRAAVQNEGGLR